MEDIDLQQYEFGIECDDNDCSDYASNIAKIVCCNRSFFLCDSCWAELSEFIIIMTISQKKLECMVCHEIHDMPFAGFELEKL